MKLLHKIFPWFKKKSSLSKFDKQTRRFKRTSGQNF